MAVTSIVFPVISKFNKILTDYVFDMLLPNVKLSGSYIPQNLRIGSF